MSKYKPKPPPPVIYNRGSCKTKCQVAFVLGLFSACRATRNSSSREVNTSHTSPHTSTQPLTTAAHPVGGHGGWNLSQLETAKGRGARRTGQPRSVAGRKRSCERAYSLFRINCRLTWRACLRAGGCRRKPGHLENMQRSEQF